MKHRDVLNGNNSMSLLTIKRLFHKIVSSLAQNQEKLFLLMDIHCQKHSAAIKLRCILSLARENAAVYSLTSVDRQSLEFSAPEASRGA